MDQILVLFLHKNFIIVLEEVSGGVTDETEV